MASTLPVSIADSDFTVGAVSTTPLAKIATRMAEAVINTTWNEANVMKSDFSTKLNAATTGFLDTTNAPHVTAGTVSVPNVTAPAVNIPSSVDTTQIMSTFDTKQQEQFNQLVTACNTFLTNHFPNEPTGYAAAQQWLADAITNPNSGLPLAVQQQIFGDDAARILADKVRAQDAVVAQFAGRRFPLPPDAAASAVLQIEQKAQDEMAESSRKVAIMSVEMQKFSVEKLIGLRGMALDASIKYIGALIAGPEVASRLVGIGYDAQSKLISSAADFYRADTQAAEMSSKVAQYNNSITLEAATKNQSADLALIEDKLRALLTECESIARMATSMYNNLHANAGLSVSL
jgi:hypothetical protein